MQQSDAVKEWVHTACGGCYNGCAIRVRKLRGLPVAIEGNPDVFLGGRGGLCGKGAASLMMIYDPNRLNVPLRRTNPEKGIGVDPGWKEISWEEALEEITDRLQKIRADNPQKLWLNTTTSHSYGGLANVINPWAKGFGSTQRLMGGGSLHCGNGAHHVNGQVHGSWSSAPDWRYNRYVIKWGSSKGTGSGHSMTANARLRAEAIARGAKEVCFDPMCNFAGGKATEWVPILPGTDAAVALAMSNVLLNELGVWDAEFLKRKTNLSFLVGPDGLFLRDAGTNKPLLWDPVEGQTRVFDAQGFLDCALEGEYQVQGVTCRPAFVLLKEHLKQFTPEWAFGISTVPAETIRRVAREFAEHASIGSTITIGDKIFPLRPAASVIFRGAQGHTNGTHNCFTADLLNEIVGAEDVPGGCLGWPAIRLGYPESGHFNMIPTAGEDGVIIPANFYGHYPWPIRMPSYPCHETDCTEFWTMSTLSGVLTMKDQEEVWSKLGVKTRPEMMMIFGSNFIMSVANWEDQLAIAKQMPFLVQFDIYSNETAEAVADILLPDLCFLERLDWHTNLASYFFNHPPTLEDWTYQPLLPVVDKPAGQRRDSVEVLCELADRLGFRREWNGFYNNFFKITDSSHRLEPEASLSWQEMGDKVLKWCFGEDKGIDYIKEHGYITWPKKVEEVYWRWQWESLQDVRIPVYHEYHLPIRARVEEIGKKTGLDLEYEQYTPLPSYFTTRALREIGGEYDLIAYSYRDILHTNSQTLENPWLAEISKLTPYTLTITLNADTALKRGLRDGDRVCLETKTGRKEQGTLKTMLGQHPDTVAIAGQAGLWAKGRPVARGVGSNFDRLLESDLAHYDHLTLNIETCVPVKIRKI